MAFCRVVGYLTVFQRHLPFIEDACAVMYYGLVFADSCPVCGEPCIGRDVYAAAIVGGAACHRASGHIDIAPHDVDSAAVVGRDVVCNVCICNGHCLAGCIYIKSAAVIAGCILSDAAAVDGHRHMGVDAAAVGSVFRFVFVDHYIRECDFI